MIRRDARRLLAGVTALALGAAPRIAIAQRGGGSDNALIAWASVWGDTNRTGAYTCEEWKHYATKLFNAADKNHDGYVDAQEFKAIQQADSMLKGSDLGYFDDNRDGRLSRSEFVDKPNLFFVRFDKKGTCRVTLDDISNMLAAAAQKKR